MAGENAAVVLALFIGISLSALGSRFDSYAPYPRVGRRRRSEIGRGDVDGHRGRN